MTNCNDVVKRQYKRNREKVFYKRCGEKERIFKQPVEEEGIRIYFWNEG